MLPADMAEANNTYRDLNNPGYLEKPNSIIVLLYIEASKTISNSKFMSNASKRFQTSC